MIYLRLFFEFFKIGLFTFGGGYAMIPLVKDVVLKYDWLLESEFYDFIGICESTPGPIAINMATFVGYNQGGIAGSLIATLGVVLPSFIIILLVASILKKIIKNRHVQNFLDGVKPVVIALILSVGTILVFRNLGYISIDSFNFSLIGLLISLVLIILLILCKYVLKKKMNNILFIAISAILGIIFCVMMA